MKLTPKQNMIVWCLQNGWILITSCDSHCVTCCSKDSEFNFSSFLFYRMVKAGLITQATAPPFDYGITKFGMSLKTKSPFYERENN